MPPFLSYPKSVSVGKRSEEIFDIQGRSEDKYQDHEIYWGKGQDINEFPLKNFWYRMNIPLGVHLMLLIGYSNKQ